MMERLQKILSRAGVASRRHAERLMREGRVTVNGIPALELGTRADPARDDVRVDGRRVGKAERHRYILLNKPRGFVSTRSDPERRRTIMDLLAGVREYVYPVGRLDFDSEGLLLLTNDGDLAARLTHPRYGLPRVYEVRITGVPNARDLERLAQGVVLDGRRTQPAGVRLVGRLAGGERMLARRAQRGQHSGKSARRSALADGEAILRVTIREGRHRQVRRMCETIGHPVTHLRRTALGPITDTRLKPGRWRELTPEEVARLRKAVAQA
jgi:23S rRNA pseudouridine2605 synthase